MLCYNASLNLGKLPEEERKKRFIDDIATVAQINMITRNNEILLIHFSWSYRRQQQQNSNAKEEEQNLTLG